MAGTLLCMELDANSKLGAELIPGDPKPQSRNGKYLQRFIEENDLVCVNGTDLCEGVITRMRKTVNSTERSVLDYFIVCRQFLKLISQNIHLLNTAQLWVRKMKKKVIITY